LKIARRLDARAAEAPTELDREWDEEGREIRSGKVAILEPKDHERVPIDMWHG
jgi:hypothetical protein